MKIVFYGVLILVVGLLSLYTISFTNMARDSRKPRQRDLVAGKLRACPGTPNCVLSEDKASPFYIEPFPAGSDPAAAWLKIKEAVVELGGHVEKETGTYVWATFSSKFWGFVDDLELRLDAGNKVIHVRSASRAGKGDLGVNRKRVEKLRVLYMKK